MAKRKVKEEGSVLFDAYYQSIYQERWPRLLQALEQPRESVALSDGLLKNYYMDEASILAAKALSVQSGDSVLDMCAAPGGKTLVIASSLQGTGTLISNDRSSARRARLHQVITDHLDEPWRNNIVVTGHDASRWALYEQEAYDKILLDAPCSSERHVISDPKALSLWSASRPKHLAIMQFAMLASALEAVKVGGQILYSTCSINPMENQMVLEKLAKKRPGRFLP
ncbi:MAG: RsmB/NOP family class I SAM-dependent RNA methyltransferase, partial [Spirochaetia bacterium]|nr:RsmB/NOP family class I SAM-dependent RNA methyltransferase [Spirochaetia bacterium]